MSQLKHSPGPWSLEFDDVPYDGGFETMVINSENGGICMMDCPKDDMEANGNLIAAAPELLDALALALPYVQSVAGRVDGSRKVLQAKKDAAQIRATIAKAKGES